MCNLIDRVWFDQKQPKNFVADISSSKEATHELAKVEEYFRGKKQNQVEPYNNITGYMPLPLGWMNEESALYYSQVYLKFFLMNFKKENQIGNIAMSISYFKNDFMDLKNVTGEQIKVVQKVVSYIEPFINSYYQSLGIDEWY